MNPKLVKLRNGVMDRLKAKCRKGWEVHHIFGRIGRLCACRFFCTEMKVYPGAANHHDGQSKTISELKDYYRKWLREFERANIQNRSQSVCWYRCGHSATCPLYEEGPT